MSCIFCKIIGKEIPSQVVRENDEWAAIRDIQPQAPTHVLLIPKRHITGLPDCGGSDARLLSSLLLGAADLARELGVEGKGYRVVVNSGADGGQSVAHLHVHLLGGRALQWPPG